MMSGAITRIALPGAEVGAGLRPMLPVESGSGTVVGWAVDAPMTVPNALSDLAFGRLSIAFAIYCEMTSVTRTSPFLRLIRPSALPSTCAQPSSGFLHEQLGS